MTAVPLIMVVGVGVEVTHWTAVRLELQRTADLAALGGALEYALASDAESAAKAAASVAELNGAAGAATPTWNAGSQTLTDGRITVQVGAGVRNNSNSGVAVTVTQPVPLALTAVKNVLSSANKSLTSVTIAASGWAEVAANMQPCILALDSSAKANGVTAQGNPNLTLTGCSVRSNASISDGGSASMSAPAFYANDTITGRGISGKLYPNAGAAVDPYATNKAVQGAFGRLNPGTGTSPPKNVPTLAPGTYSDWDIKGTVILSSGIYYVNGDISLGAQASVSGTGVTIITSGTVTMTGGATLAISAARTDDTAAQANGAIPGIVFASTSTSGVSLRGNTSPLLTGVMYVPNGDIDFRGTAQGGTTGCLEVVAKSVTLGGDSAMASQDCSNYGLAPGSGTVALVQ